MHKYILINVSGLLTSKQTYYKYDNIISYGYNTHRTMAINIYNKTFMFRRTREFLTSY